MEPPCAKPCVSLSYLYNPLERLAHYYLSAQGNGLRQGFSQSLSKGQQDQAETPTIPGYTPPGGYSPEGHKSILHTLSPGQIITHWPHRSTLGGANLLTSRVPPTSNSLQPIWGQLRQVCLPNPVCVLPGSGTLSNSS